MADLVYFTTRERVYEQHPLDGTHLVAVRGLIHQEVPECANEESSTESPS